MSIRPILFLATALLASGPAMATEPPVLRIGMDTRSRPWAFVPGLDYSKEDLTARPKVTPAQLDQLQGVDIDFVKALASRLHAVPRFVAEPWNHIEEGLLAKRYDLLINAWVPNLKTSPLIAVSSPYLEWGLVIAVAADNTSVQSFEDLAGKRVGYFADPVIQRSADNLRARELVAFDDSDRLFEALRSKRVDAAVEDSTYVTWRVAHDKAFRTAGKPLNKLGYVVGFRKEDEELRGKVDEAIRQLVQSGEMERIRKHWASGTDTPGPPS